VWLGGFVFGASTAGACLHEEHVKHAGATGLRLVDRDGTMQKQTTFGRLALRVDPPHRASRRLGRLSLPCRVCPIKNHRGRCTCTSWIVEIACAEMAEIKTTHRLYIYFAQSSKPPCDLIFSSPIAEVVSKLRLVQIPFYFEFSKASTYCNPS
jgi:hypothetical protein